ncbi:kinase-like domain-containing protein [Mycena pura]|uniref:Kinase-like domain-containing protein n=1 Tax=Mycena pura TaxID=153505 RepID=A0AAD6Y2G8_9AGAR|nr:kinase-like domain-containing protein [Mycena pura]
MIVKLSVAYNKLPSALFTSGVTECDKDPRFGGGFGDIYQASLAGNKVALKRIRVFSGDEGYHHVWRVRCFIHPNRASPLKFNAQQFCREALIWQALQHPCILPFIGLDCDTFPGFLTLVSPWMENNTVLKYLKANGKASVDKLLFEIAQGLQYLHSKNLVHGDLRGVNILITDEGSACLADFGLSYFSETTTTTSSARAGCIQWMAPELIDPSKFGKRFLRTPATDVYAFGCVCLELYTGMPPFGRLPGSAAIFQVPDGKRPERPTGDATMSEALWGLVGDCWAQQSAERPQSEAVVERMELLNTAKV